MLYQKHGKTLLKITLILLITSQLRTSHHTKKKDYFNKQISKKELDSTLVSNVENKSTSEIYFQNNFSDKLIKWDKIYYYHGKLHVYDVTHIYDPFSIKY